NAQFRWSPSSRDILMTLNPEDPATTYQVNIDNPLRVRNIADSVATLTETWDKETQANFKELTANFPKDVQSTITQNQSTIQWSPDNLKFMYQTEVDGKYTYHIYDKETKKQQQ